MFFSYFKVALLMMRQRPLRSALSILGIYIGVLSLVAILSLQAGMRHKIDQLYRTEDAAVYLIQPAFDQATQRVGSLNLSDLSLIAAVEGVQGVMPRQSAERNLRSGPLSAQANCLGIDEGFIDVYRISIRMGRAFLPKEGRSRQPVMILTQALARKLFPLSDPIGAMVAVDGVPFEVVGLADWDETVTTRAFLPAAPGALLPAAWLERPGVKGAVPMIEVRADPRAAESAMVGRLRSALSHGEPRRQALYSIESLKAYLAREKELGEQTLATLLAIAAISLLVGGIGIANVMLTAVTERTQEIGIRKALGARRKDILRQFLIESCILSVSGGLLATATARAAIAALPALYPSKIMLVMPLLPVFACLILTVIVGVVAGLYPASRAAASLPADALRHE